jgi:DNA-binding NarL/FixJ family response regulator
VLGDDHTLVRQGLRKILEEQPEWQAVAEASDGREAVASKGIADRYDALSEREREIFQLVAEGHSNKEAAELLHVSPATVETHRAHILEKLDVHNTAELVLFAVRRGVIS